MIDWLKVGIGCKRTTEVSSTSASAGLSWNLRSGNSQRSGLRNQWSEGQLSALMHIRLTAVAFPGSP